MKSSNVTAAITLTKMIVLIGMAVWMSGCAAALASPAPLADPDDSPAARAIALSLTGSPGDPVFIKSYGPADSDGSGILEGMAYLYDNALAAIALTAGGKHEDARRIADAIVYAQEHDRWYTDGRLRNAYAPGDPRSPSGSLSERGEEFALLPGYYDDEAQSWQEDYYAVSTATGNMGWALLALCRVGENAPDPDRDRYIQAARRLGEFLLTLESPTGGFFAGYEGWEHSETKATYLSTEHNIDLVAAFGALGRLTGDGRWQGAADSARRFVMSMYDSRQHCFYTGTLTDGTTVNTGVMPLDTNTWAVLALGDEAPDPRGTLAYIEEHFSYGEGFDYQSREQGGGVWFEGTGQVCVAYAFMGESARYTSLLAYLRSQATDGALPSADRDGLSTGFSDGSGQALSYGRRMHLGAGAWLAFAELGYNPFDGLYYAPAP
ncbi:MAG: hypothetical protein LBR77_02075 [Lachnospiraceae bacterium]|jgi:hypothetical protein|nr:hypothetical protein [Lachnospiraceae bacterium]